MNEQLAIGLVVVFVGIFGYLFYLEIMKMKLREKFAKMEERHGRK